MVWACCWRSVDTRTYNATCIGRPFLLCYRRRRRPAQHQLVRLVPSVLPIGLLADLPPDLEGAPHGRPPAAGSAHSEGLHPPTSPQPQRPPPPGQPKLAVAGPAELVTCDQTIEHTVRFAKQTLGWTTPRPRHPAQADRWTWLVLAAYTQLRLARQAAADARLPWERPRPQPRLSPVRVRRGFPRLLCVLGSPAAAPKPAGRPPGRPKGRVADPATRYPAIKKPTKKPRKKPPTAAKAA